MGMNIGFDHYMHSTQINPVTLCYFNVARPGPSICLFWKMLLKVHRAHRVNVNLQNGILDQGLFRCPMSCLSIKQKIYAGDKIYLRGSP